MRSWTDSRPRSETFGHDVPAQTAQHGVTVDPASPRRHVIHRGRSVSALQRAYDEEPWLRNLDDRTMPADGTTGRAPRSGPRSAVRRSRSRSDGAVHAVLRSASRAPPEPENEVGITTPSTIGRLSVLRPSPHCATPKGDVEHIVRRIVRQQATVTGVGRARPGISKEREEHRRDRRRHVPATYQDRSGRRHGDVADHFVRRLRIPIQIDAAPPPDGVGGNGHAGPFRPKPLPSSGMPVTCMTRNATMGIRGGASR